MNIVNILTLRHIKTHKKRSVLTILAIIVSVAMVTAVFTSAFSFINYFKNVSEAIDGSWHTYIHTDEFKDTESNLDTDSIEKYGIDMWYARADVDGNTDSLEMYMNAVDDNYLELRNVVVSEGRAPLSENELLVHKKFMDRYKLDWKLGDTVKLPVDKNGEIEDKNFTIVGITDSNVAETDSISGFVFATDDLKYSNQNLSVYIRYKELSKSIYDDSKALADKLDPTLEEGVNRDYGFNNEYLTYSGYGQDNEVIVTLAGFCAIILAIIAIVSIFMIYDSFAVSYQERARYLGMLASVGATKKQKRASVYFEGFILGLVGIPLGIVAGIGGIWVTFKAISDVWISTLGVEYDNALTVNVNWLVVLGTVIASAVTIFVSSYIPARKASRTTAIDAIRQTNMVKVKHKRLRSSKLVSKLLGFEGTMAVKNFKRNGRRSRNVVFALFMSVVVFVSVTNFSMMFKEVTNFEFVESSDLTYTVPVKYSSDLDSVLRDNDNITSYYTSCDEYADIDSKYFNDECKDMNLQLIVVFVNSEAIDDYAKQLGVDNSILHNKSKPAGILHNAIATRVEDKKTTLAPFKNVQGKDIHCKINYWNNNTAATEAISKDLSVAYQTKENWHNDKFFFQLMHYPVIMYSIEHVGNILPDMNTGYTANICADDSELVEEEILSIMQNKNIESRSYNATAQMNAINNILKIVDVFVFGFIALITLISVMNIINTISNSMNERRREFAMIRSVGMTPKSFKKMVYYESLRYGIMSLLWGIPTSVAIQFLMYKMLNNSYSLGFKIYPLVYLAAIVAVFVIIGVAILYSTSKIKDDNIIETLKLDIN